MSFQIGHKEHVDCPYCGIDNEVTLYFSNLSEDNGTVLADCGSCGETMILKVAYTTKLKVGKIEYGEEA